MKSRELQNLGVPRGPALRAAQAALASLRLPRDEARARIQAVIADPAAFAADPHLGALAREIAGAAPLERPGGPAPHRLWGVPGEDFDQASLEQLKDACTLPVAVAGALMPDAHVGYGLPIGGVLATDNAVIPFAVGVDIACRMKLSVLDLPAGTLQDKVGRDRLRDALETQTAFGMGAEFGPRHASGTRQREHAVLEADWSVSPVTARARDKAARQLGSSGSGNHFVEFGELVVPEGGGDPRLGLAPGAYLALLSHSGSRGAGAAVCDHYSRLAMEMHPDLPRQLRHLAWLGLDSQEGAEYWAAMNLMGEYASANHACIHEAVARRLGARVVAGVENHHNFAWKERHAVAGSVREVIVHRKGATPAHRGVLGVIPGTMADPTYIVRGLEGAGSLASSSHGAGRVMSRTQARQTFRWPATRRLLAERGVEVLSAGIDEAPMVYKDINTVMSRQSDLVEVVARFTPRLVKMAPEGERAED